MTRPLDGVAIVGMAGRFPGAASIDEFWRNLISGTESITRFERTQLSSLVPAEISAHPRYVAARGVIADADRFDAEFFGITPADAALIDPQQRVFLELCWNALEHAGIDAAQYSGSIGVYAGVSNNSYRRLVEARADFAAPGREFAAMLANEKDYVATRVAHRIGLTGPAISLYTACSTSLVAVAQAWYALMSWQCDAALAGGINIAVPQESGYLPVDGGMESGDGRCRPFDAGANGTVFSSGGGVVVLKRLADALADNDTIWAVIRGVGVNNDGAEKASFTAPSARGQAAAIRMALATADVSADSIGYVEAHGTGTALGDPIEVEGLTRAFAEDTGARQFCWLGSVKSNFGHLVSASGVAGLIKSVLALHHGHIPPTLHYDRANPEIEFAATPFKVADRAIPWPQGAQPRRAGISSFGVGGTNAHVIIEEPPQRSPAAAAERLALVLPLSARDAHGLRDRADALSAALDSFADGDLADIGWSLAVGRRQLSTRAAIVASTVASARENLRELKPRTAIEDARIVFLFPGQGSQYPGMARELVQTEPAFADAFEQCCALATQALGCDLRALILPREDARDQARSELARTRHSQPALFAVEYALAQLWRSWGVEPDAMIGHSVGEYVAACLAGVFSLEDGVRLVVARAAAMDAQPGGAMLAVRLPHADLARRLTSGLEIAAFNAPDANVVAGGAAEIEELAQRLAREQVAHSLLQVSHAFHSRSMDGALPVFRGAFEGVALHAPRVPYYSCVTGRLVDARDATSADYWCLQIRAPVRFAAAAAHALGDPRCLALEVGPGQALSGLLRRSPDLRRRAVASLGSAGEAASDSHRLAAAVGELWSLGGAIDWPRYWNAAQRRRVPLPGYPFRGPRCWVDVAQAPAALERREKTAGMLVGAAALASAPEPSSLRDELREYVGSLSAQPGSVIPDDATFLDLGLDSLALTQMSLELETRYGLRLKFRRLMEDVDTIAKLVAAIADSAAEGSIALLAAGGVQAGSAQAVEALAGPRNRAHASSTHALPVPGSGRAVGSARDARLQSERSAAEGATSAEPTEPVAFGAQARIATRSAGELGAAQERWLQEFTRRYVARTKKSKQFSESNRAQMADPRVVTGFNPRWKELVYPIVVERSSGAHLWDLDGNRYIDLLNAFGANFLGYQPEFVARALREQIDAGFEIGPQHPLSAEVAALIREITGVERVAFCNTGSEAVMGAMRIARTVTGRKTIVVFKDSYHGIFDEVIVRGTGTLRSIAAAPGILASAVENVLVLDYGSAAALDTIRERAATLAAVMIEPVQARNPTVQPRAFVQALREICDASGCALIFDEVITGFRVSPGGAQEFYDVRADIVTYGKIIGGGLPLAAIAGAARWMDALDGGAWRFGDDSAPDAGVTYFAGTFVRHPLALAAARAALLHLRECGPGLQRDLNARTSRLVTRLNAFFDTWFAPLHAVCFSSLWRIHADADQPFAELFYYALRERGLHVYAQFNCFVSAAHGDAEIDQIASAVESATIELLDAGILRRTATPIELGRDRNPPTHERAGTTSAQRPGATTHPAQSSGAGDPPSEVALTDAQTEKWIASQFGALASVAFNESQLLTLHGDLDCAALEQAVMRVSARHEAFAMSFAPDGGVLRVGPAVAITPRFVDIEGDGGDPAALERHCAGQIGRPFDLTRAPLARVDLIRLGPHEHALLVVGHHLIFDGWSAAIFFDEVAALYSAARTGRTSRLHEAQSFRQFAIEQRGQREGEEARRQLDYWKHLFADPPGRIDLPTDRPQPPDADLSANTVFHDFPPAFTAAVGELARRNGVTAYATLLAAFGVLLARLSGQSDLSVGIPFASQAPAGRHTMIGDGVNTLPVRLKIDPAETFSALSRRCHRALLDAADNHGVTMYTLLSAVEPARRAGLRTATDIIFNLNPRVPALDFGTLEYSLRDCAKVALAKELFFNFSDSGKGLTLDLHYRTGMFDAATVRAWIGQYEALLIAAATFSGSVASLPGTVESRERKLAVPGDGTANGSDAEATVFALIRDQARRSPERVAIEFAGRHFSYEQVLKDASAVARALRQAGAGAGDIVGIGLARGADMLVALLGVMASGAAYLPLDTGHPEARVRSLLAHAGVRHVVVHHPAQFSPAIASACALLRFDDLVSAGSGSGELPHVPGSAPAYVLYTSGSTGVPKGVCVLQRNLTAFLLAMRERPGLSADDVVCATSPLSFDIAGLELFLPLLVGARVLIAPEDARHDPDALIDLLHEGRATVLQTTPSWLRALTSGGRAGRLPRMKLLIGGEELPRNLAESVLPHCTELWNMYGPTETTVWSAAGRVTSGQGSVPIGTPIAQTQIHILDANRNPLPEGARGEIWIGGAGVASGYLHQPDLTAERFQSDPFAGGGRIYRTGDIGSWSHGQLYFHGRADDQVKLRGFRIEPAEVEAAALADASVTAAVAGVCEFSELDRRLVLYVVAPGARDGFVERLRDELRNRLPPYMVPQHVERVESLPQTPHGKIDRKALPAPQAVSAPAAEARVPAAEQGDALEIALREIWRDLLGVKVIDLDSNFFDAGGDSLLGVELFQRAHALTGVNLPLATLLTAQTVREQARAFREAGARNPAGGRRPSAVHGHADEWSPLVAIQATGSLPPLFCVHALGGNVLNYVPLARAIGADQPFYGLQAIGLDGITPPLATVEDMAARYVREIRARFPRGPYFLCGGSMGGLIALEMAQLLRADNEQVAFLGLFDTYGPQAEPPSPRNAGTAIRARERWHERWIRLRTLDRDGRRVMIAEALQRRLYRLADALSAIVCRWRGTPLPHGVRYRTLERIHLRADDTYQARPYRGPMTLFRASDQPESLARSRALGWQDVALGTLEVVDLPGTHDTLIEQPGLAQALRGALERARNRLSEDTDPVSRHETHA